MKGKVMNSNNGSGTAFLLAVIVGFASSAKADEQGEADFLALRNKVGLLRANEPEAVRTRISSAASDLTDCLPGTPEPQWGSRAGTAIEDVDYLYGNPDTNADGSTRCFYIVEPLHRPLTLDEARDFSAALMMPDLQHATVGKRGRAAATKAAQAAARRGEANFHEIRHLLASRTAPFRDSNYLADIAPLVGDLSDLVDCSNATKAELDGFVAGQRSTSYNRTIYNDTYWWEDIALNGGRCIYVTSPMGRGLTADEARDFLTSLQLDLGFSAEMLKSMEDEKQFAPAAEKKLN